MALESSPAEVPGFLCTVLYSSQRDRARPASQILVVRKDYRLHGPGPGFPLWWERLVPAARPWPLLVIHRLACRTELKNRVIRPAR